MSCCTENAYEQIIKNIVRACKNHQELSHYTPPNYGGPVDFTDLNTGFAEGREDLASELLADIQESCKDWALTDIEELITKGTK